MATNLFRMFTAASEKTRRLDPEIADFFLVAIDFGDAVFRLERAQWSKTFLKCETTPKLLHNICVV